MLQNGPNFCSRLEQLTVSMRVSVQPAGSVEFIEEKRGGPARGPSNATKAKAVCKFQMDTDELAFKD